MAANMTKVPVREQDPQVRAHNFEEVCLGYNMEEAMQEAQRCLHCKKAPCVSGCPVNVPIPDFIDKLKQGATYITMLVVINSFNFFSTLRTKFILRI